MLPSDPQEGTSTGIQRKATLVTKHCSDLRAVKRQLNEETSITKPGEPLTHESTDDQLPDLVELPNLQSTLEDPEISPKKVRFSIPTPTEPDQLPVPNMALDIFNTPLEDPQHMDGPGGSPFISDPDVPMNTIWDEVLNNKGPVSPIRSPRKTDPAQPPRIEVVLPSVPTVHNHLDIIGEISSSESEEEETIPPPAPPAPPIADELSVNQTILDIIGEVSIINETSLSKDLSKYHKALKQVQKILVRVNKRIVKL